MTRALVRAALGGVLALAVLAGCGVPDHSGVITDSAPLGADNSRQGTPVDKYTPERAHDEKELVEYYLRSAGTDPDRMRDSVTAFLTQNAQASWAVSADITVIDAVVGTPALHDNGVTEVTVTGNVVGRLTDNGVFEPASGEWQFTFVVMRGSRPAAGRNDGATFYIDRAAPGYVLSLAALQDPDQYQQRQLFFWGRGPTDADESRPVRVPDLRYLPADLSRNKQLRYLIGWLAAGPSPWLRPAVRNEFHEGTALRGDPVEVDGKVTADLSNAAGAPSDQLYAQLAWTLRDDGVKRIVLKIDGQYVDGGVGRDTSAPGLLAPGPVDTTRSTLFYLSGGGVRAVNLTTGKPADLPALFDKAPEAKAGVAEAAVARDMSVAALVKTDGTLWLGAADGRTRYQQVKGVTGAMSRPVFVHTVDGPRLLVVQAGRLWEVAPPGPNNPEPAAAPVDLPAGAAIPSLSAVSVSPDGYRIALVGDGKVYVGVLTRPGRFGVQNLRQVRPVLSPVKDVAWSRLTALVVCGVPIGEQAAAVLGVDGLPLQTLRGHGNGVPAHVAAVPGTASLNSQGTVVLEVAGELFVAGPGSADQLPGTGTATAPFFAD